MSREFEIEQKCSSCGKDMVLSLDLHDIGWMSVSQGLSLSDCEHCKSFTMVDLENIKAELKKRGY